MEKLLAAAVLLGSSLALVDGKRRDRREAELAAESDWRRQMDRSSVCFHPRKRVVRLVRQPCLCDHSNGSYAALGLRAPRTVWETAWDRIWTLKDAAAKCMVAASYNK